MRVTPRIAIAVAATAVAASTAASAFADPPRPSTPVGAPARATPSFVEPLAVSPACRKDARRESACNLVRDFFRATNSRRFVAACSFLGQRLRSETHGLTCPRFLAAGVPEPVPWAIHGARVAGRQVAVFVVVGQSELDHYRMLLHRADVGREGHALKILDTRLVRELG